MLTLLLRVFPVVDQRLSCKLPGHRGLCSPDHNLGDSCVQWTFWRTW